MNGFSGGKKSKITMITMIECRKTIKLVVTAINGKKQMGIFILWSVGAWLTKEVNPSTIVPVTNIHTMKPIVICGIAVRKSIWNKKPQSKAIPNEPNATVRTVQSGPKYVRLYLALMLVQASRIILGKSLNPALRS